MRITRAVTLAVTTATLLLGLMAPAMSTPETSGQCPEGGVKVQDQGASTIDVDGTMVTATISDESVSFTDGDGRPIDVTFCVKASDDNSGTHTGSSWTVQLENDGGQTPAISHVVIYDVTETASPDAEFDFEAELTGECVDDDATTTVAGVVHHDDAVGVVVELYRDDVRVDQTTLDGSGVATVSDVLAAGDQAEYLLHVDGNEVAAASLVNSCTEADANPDGDTESDGEGVDTGTAVPPTGNPDGDDTQVIADDISQETVVPPSTVDDTEVLDATVGAADGTDADADQLAATGLPLLVLALMGLVALVAGTGVLTTGRRR